MWLEILALFFILSVKIPLLFVGDMQSAHQQTPGFRWFERPWCARLAQIRLCAPLFDGGVTWKKRECNAKVVGREATLKKKKLTMFLK